MSQRVFIKNQIILRIPPPFGMGRVLGRVPPPRPTVIKVPLSHKHVHFMYPNACKRRSKYVGQGEGLPARYTAAIEFYCYPLLLNKHV
jgi:hypothetical protein